MDKLLNRIGKSEGACGSCSTGGCGTCSPASPKLEAPAVLSRRQFGYTALAASAAAVLAGCSKQEPAEAAAAPLPPALSPELNVVQSSKGPVMTTLEEFYKMGPGPSSSHTMGPMRITYDFFQKVSKLPDDQLKRATALKVHLYGSQRNRKRSWDRQRISGGPVGQGSRDVPTRISRLTGGKSG